MTKQLIAFALAAAFGIAHAADVKPAAEAAKPMETAAAPTAKVETPKPVAKKQAKKEMPKAEAAPAPVSK